MPTSGESGIHPSSSYNLRSKPLPKTGTTRRPTTRSTSNKENIGTGRTAPSTRLTKKTEKSKIPVPQTSKIPVLKSATSKSTTPARRKVPDFEKLHKSWNKKFHQGKAVSKKPCTQTEAFDLTKPGTQFKSAYYAGTGKDVKTRRQTGIGLRIDDDFEVDSGALNDILNGRGLEEEESEPSVLSSRATLAGTGIASEFPSQANGRRQTLGQLPSTGSGRVNNSSNVSSAREIDKGSRLGQLPTTGAGRANNSSNVSSTREIDKRSRLDRGKKSLVQEQKEAGICFEASADALASILNNTGLHPSSVKQHDNVLGGRQTIAGISAKQRQSGRFNTTGRNSIYYQKPKNHDVNKVYSEFAKRTLSRFTMDGNQASYKTAFIESLLPDNRGSLYIKPGVHTSEKAADMPQSSLPVAKSLTPSRVLAADKTKRRTPGTAARIRNPNFNEVLSRQEQSCSPALTPSRRIPITPGGQCQKNVRWADVLSSPREQCRGDDLSTKDVVAVLNFGDDGDEAISPETKSRINEVEKLEAETVVNRQKLNEMEEIEKQLELEIARLHEEEAIEDVAPSEQPFTTLPHVATSEYAVEHNLLDHVPTKQPADHVDPIKLTKDRVETVPGSVPGSIPGSVLSSVPGSKPGSVPSLRAATHGFAMPKLDHHDHMRREQVGSVEAAVHTSASLTTRPGVGISGIASHGHAQKEQLHLQHRSQRGGINIEEVDFEREFSLENGGVQNQQDGFQSGQSYVQTTDSGRNFNNQRDTSEKIAITSSNSISARSIGMKGSSSSNIPYNSQLSSSILDSNMARPVVDTISGGSNGTLQASGGSLGFPSSFGPRGTIGETLMVSDSTESFRGVYPAFLQNSCQSSQRPHFQGSANLGHDPSPGEASMQTSSAIRSGTSTHGSGHVNHAETPLMHRVGGEMMNKNAVPFTHAQSSIRSLITATEPLGQRTGVQSSMSHVDSASGKQHVQYSNELALENSRPAIHTPQPVRRARNGTLFMKPPLDSRSMSTPLHHSSILPTPIQTPLSLRNPSIMSTNGQDHQHWPSPVVANNFSSKGQIFGEVHPFSASITSMVQPQSYPQPSKPSFSNSLQLPGANSGDTPSLSTANTAIAQSDVYSHFAKPTYSNPVQPTETISSAARTISTSNIASYAHPEEHAHSIRQAPVAAVPAFPAFPSAYPKVGAHHNLGLPASLAQSDFQYKRPRSSSVSDVNQMIWSQGQSSGVTRSLSLSENLMDEGHHGQVQPVGGRMDMERESSSQLFHQVLLDEECALYACRLKGRHTPQSLEPRPMNPIAKIILYGDDMHFVPVRNISYVVSPPPGSAFSSYHHTAT